MIWLLDTNACITYLRYQDSPIRRKIAATNPSEIALCSVVKAELYHGAFKSARPEQSLTRLNIFCAPFTSLPFDDHAAEEFGNVRAQLEKQGTPIGPYDLMIAAIALVNNVTLVTRNTREFSRIGKLQLEDWESK